MKCEQCGCQIDVDKKYIDVEEFDPRLVHGRTYRPYRFCGYTCASNWFTQKALELPSPAGQKA